MAETVVRFDKLLTELHLPNDARTATVCGDPMPADNSVVWIDWEDDGTPHCAECFGETRQEESSGHHDQHVRDWNIRPGLIGGAWCPCEGEPGCTQRAQEFAERLIAQMFPPPPSHNDVGREASTAYQHPAPLIGPAPTTENEDRNG